MPAPAKLTPMLRHYAETKAQHADAIVLYRMGDFYEIFFEDAELVAPILEVALTARHKGKESEVAMCGVPHHALEAYLAKLLKAGYKVAICDQVEDPAEAKGLVRREVTRIVTPGTLSDLDLLSSRQPNLLAGVAFRGSRGNGGYEGIGAGAFLDVSTGDFFLREWTDGAAAVQDLRALRPAELVHVEEALPEPLGDWTAKSQICVSEAGGAAWFPRGKEFTFLCRHFGTRSLKGFGLVDRGHPGVAAAALALAYARETQRSELPHVRGLSVRAADGHLQLDPTTVANLELLKNLRTSRSAGSLLAVMDRTETAPGARRLADWLLRPLQSVEAIELRQGAVGELLDEAERRERIRRELRSLGDPARLATRAVLGTLTPREADGLRRGLGVVPAILAELQGARSSLLAELAAVDPLADLAGELGRVLAPEPALTLKKGGVVADGVDEELDRCRSLARDRKKHLAALEGRERESTGIGSLKIRYNKVFGYYLEVTKANQSLVPEHYVRKQTLVNAERYATPELKELEEEILEAEGRQLELEAAHFSELVQRIGASAGRLQDLASAMASVDVLAALAELAERNRYSRPRMLPSGEPVNIVEGRHPVVEASSSDSFVPNDLELGGEAGDIIVLTGPNMGGKSTYLRQCALIVLMAHTGSFVPAKSAEIGVVDRIFTRVGASDDLARGESTFMVEMTETANILHNASGRSLIILDEVGRGTATFDGLSLAWAIVEHLHEETGARALFATHYHELTELAVLLPRVVNRTLAVKEWRNQIVFLHRVMPGSADKSYGIHVARLAGIPESVVARAAQVLSNLEAGEYDLTGKPKLAASPDDASLEGQLALFAPPEQIVASILRELDLERLSPLAALNLLQTLKARLDG